MFQKFWFRLQLVCKWEWEAKHWHCELSFLFKCEAGWSWDSFICINCLLNVIILQAVCSRFVLRKWLVSTMTELLLIIIKNQRAQLPKNLFEFAISMNLHSRYWFFVAISFINLIRKIEKSAESVLNSQKKKDQDRNATNSLLDWLHWE